MLGCLLFTQCLESSYQNTDGRIKILRAISSDLVLARYEEFMVLSETLFKATAALCEDPNEERLEIARTAWWDARLPWKRAEVVTFGPTFDYPYRLKFRIDDWPVNSDAVEELIADDQTLATDSFSERGSAHRGLPVIEYLLWSEVEDAPTVQALTTSPRRCAMLVAVSEDLHANATQLVTLWSAEWIDLLQADDADKEAKFKSPEALIVEWVNRLTFTIENIRVKKLEKPLGDLSPQDVKPDVIESHFSGRSLQDARDALRGVHELWGGVNGEREKVKGLGTIVVDRRVVSLIDRLFDEAIIALDRLQGPFELLTTTQRADVEYAINALKDLQVAVQTDLATATESTIRFNDTTDGD